MQIVVLFLLLIVTSTSSTTLDKTDQKDDTSTLLLVHPLNRSKICQRKGGDKTCTYFPEKNIFEVNSKSLTCHLKSGILRPKFCIDAMLSLLSTITVVLELEEIPYWITQGTLLGATRNGEIIPWTNDVDISVLFSDFPKIINLLDTISGQDAPFLSQEKFASSSWKALIYTLNSKEGSNNDKINTGWISIVCRFFFTFIFSFFLYRRLTTLLYIFLSFSTNSLTKTTTFKSNGVIGVHLDINGRTPDIDYQYFHEACNKDMHPCNQKSGKHHVKLNDIFPLVDMMISGRIFWAPRLHENVLKIYYGTDWNVVDRYGEGAWGGTGNIHSLDEKDREHSGTIPTVTTISEWENRPRVYVDVVGDMFHYGHVRLFERAKKMGKTLVVGVHSDETVESYKRRPILTMKERINIIKSCRYVDEVIPHAPLILTAEYMDKHKIDLVVRGDDQLAETSRKSYGVAMDRNQFRTVTYTEEISTSEILNRILDRGDELRKKKEKNRLTVKIEV